MPESWSRARRQEPAALANKYQSPGICSSQSSIKGFKAFSFCFDIQYYAGKRMCRSLVKRQLSQEVRLQSYNATFQPLSMIRSFGYWWKGQPAEICFLWGWLGSTDIRWGAQTSERSSKYSCYMLRGASWGGFGHLVREPVDTFHVPLEGENLGLAGGILYISWPRNVSGFPPRSLWMRLGREASEPHSWSCYHCYPDKCL